MPGMGGACFSTTRELAKERRQEQMDKSFMAARRRTAMWQEQRRSLMLDMASGGGDVVFARLSSLRDSDVQAAKARSLQKEYIMTRATDDKHFDGASANAIVETKLFKHLYGNDENERRGGSIKTTSPGKGLKDGMDPPIRESSNDVWGGMSVSLPVTPTVIQKTKVFKPAKLVPGASLELNGGDQGRWQDPTPLFDRYRGGTSTTPAIITKGRIAGLGGSGGGKLKPLAETVASMHKLKVIRET